MAGGALHLARAIEEIGNMIRPFTSPEMLNNITNALRAINSLGALKGIAERLVSPVTLALYGVSGFTVGMIIISAIRLFIENKHDNDLAEILNIQILGLNLQAAQAQAQIFEMRQVAARNLDPNDPEDQVRLRNLREEARIIVDHTPPATREALAGIQTSIHRVTIEMLRRALYIEAPTELEGYLGQVDFANFNAGMAQEHCKFLVYSKKALAFSPTMPRELLGSRITSNYTLICHLYNEFEDPIIDRMMQVLSEMLYRKGGRDLYQTIVYGGAALENSPRVFIRIMSLLMINWLTNQPTIVELTPQEQEFRASTNKMLLFLNNNALNNLDVQIAAIRQRYRNFNLSLEEKRIIVFRAINSFICRMSPYFFAPYNVPREIAEGAFDTVKGMWSVVRHPWDTIVNVATLPFVLLADYQGRRTALLRSIAAHPTRFTTSIVASSVISSAAASGLRAAGSSMAARTAASSVAGSQRVHFVSDSARMSSRIAQAGQALPSMAAPAAIMPAAAEVATTTDIVVSSMVGSTLTASSTLQTTGNNDLSMAQCSRLPSPGTQRRAGSHQSSEPRNINNEFSAEDAQYILTAISQGNLVGAFDRLFPTSAT